MRDFPGAPGTLPSLLLRISQFLFAALTVFQLSLIENDYGLTALGRGFSSLVWPMVLHAGWNLGIILIDVFALAKKAIVHTYDHATLLVILDWVAATTSLAVASALAATSMHISYKIGCTSGARCRMFQMSFVSASLSWLANAISHFIALWVVAGGR